MNNILSLSFLGYSLPEITLKGSERRQFMAKVVKELGVGGQTLAEQELGWNRGTIRKGMQEFMSGKTIEDAFHRRGRKRIEEKLPNLRSDIRNIVDPYTQADPTLKSQRLYTRMSAAEVRRQLIQQKGYRDEELPTAEVIRQRLNAMNYCLRRVVKAKATVKVGDYDRGGKKSADHIGSRGVCVASEQLTTLSCPVW